MSKEKLSKEEVEEMQTDIKKNRKYTYKQFKSDAKATWNGLVKLVRFLAELTVGASAAITLGTAYLYVKNSTYPKPVVYILTFGVTLMVVTALAVLGRYLIAKGRK